MESRSELEWRATRACSAACSQSYSKSHCGLIFYRSNGLRGRHLLRGLAECLAAGPIHERHSALPGTWGWSGRQGVKGRLVDGEDFRSTDQKPVQEAHDGRVVAWEQPRLLPGSFRAKCGMKPRCLLGLPAKALQSELAWLERALSPSLRGVIRVPLKPHGR